MSEEINDTWIPVYAGPDEMKASIIHGLLAEGGFPVTLEAPWSQSIYPMAGSAFGEYRVLCPKTEVASARALIDQFVAENNPDGDR